MFAIKSTPSKAFLHKRGFKNVLRSHKKFEGPERNRFQFVSIVRNKDLLQRNVRTVHGPDVSLLPLTVPKSS